MTIVEFLLARIAEDEAANQPGGKCGEADQWHRLDCDLNTMDPMPCDCELPQRVLAECVAKRSQIKHLVRFMEGEYAPWNEEQLQIMAAVYAEHADFDEAWR